jgi:hypothetical protein
VFAFAIAAIRTAERVTFTVVSNLPWLRRKIFGRHHIEGLYFDAVLDAEKKQVTEYGLIEIRVEEGNIRVSGILFNTNLKKIGHFCSEFSRYEKQELRLKFAYVRQISSDIFEKASGLAEYAFSKELPYPMGFTGTFFDPARDRLIALQGIRIDSAKDEALLWKAFNRRRGDGVETRTTVLKKIRRNFLQRKT